jgi:hypothetical protein
MTDIASDIESLKTFEHGPLLIASTCNKTQNILFNQHGLW